MKNTIIHICVALISLVIISFVFPNCALAGGFGFIPLNEGNWWEYKVYSAGLSDKEGNSKVKDDGSNEVFKNTDLVKIEVLKVAKYKHVTVALFNRTPSSFVDKKATLVVADNKDYYWASEDVFDLVSEKNSDITIEELKSEIDKGYNDKADNNKWIGEDFSLPLIKNTLFNCDEEDKSRGDNYYCDWVRSIKPAKQKYFPGKVEYEIAQYTLPDESHSYFVDGVGLTYFSYSHHGSLDEERWNLQRYFISTE
jgi:hypothetical protein